MPMVSDSLDGRRWHWVGVGLYVATGGRTREMGKDSLRLHNLVASSSNTIEPIARTTSR